MRTAELGTQVDRQDNGHPIRPAEDGQAENHTFPAEATDVLRQEDLADLLARREGTCVSVFLPTHRQGQEKLQNPLRLKNLLRDAQAQIEQRGEEVDGLLTPATELIDDGDFWLRQEEGLALFAAPGFFRAYRLSVAPPEKVAVGDRFHVRPLLPSLIPEDLLYVVGLSRNHVRVLEVSATDSRRIEGSEIPENMESALGYTYHEKARDMHTVGPRGSAPGHHGGISHGHGDHDEENFKINLQNYFRQVAKGLAKALPDRKAPLVLAAVSEYLTRFEEAANGDLGELVGSIPGSPDHVSDEDLVTRGREILAQRWEERRVLEVQRFQDLMGTSRAKQDLVPLIPAAAYGRVDEIFLAEDAEPRFGTFDYDTGKVQVHQTSQHGSEDLLERLVRDTLGNSGRVHTLPRELMPDGGDVAAVLRY